jgi:hypothetical protein
VIEFDSPTVAALKAWKARQAQERLLLGAGYQDRGLLFCHPDGRPYHPERFSREFDRMVERLKIRRIRLHDYADLRVMPTCGRRRLSDGVTTLARSA